MKKSIAVSALIILIILILTGCSTMKKMLRTPVAGLMVDPSFNYTSVIQGQLIVGGVVSSIDELKETEHSRYANTLRFELQDERKNFQVTAAHALKGYLGAVEYDRLLLDYKANGGLTDSWLSNLSQRISQRYIVFGAISSDDVENKLEEKKKEKKVVASSTRSVSGSLDIYDLQQGIQVWFGIVKRTRTAQKTYDEKEKKRQNDFEKVISAVIGGGGAPTLYPYPQPPSFDQILALVFEGFGENMPEPAEK